MVIKEELKEEKPKSKKRFYFGHLKNLIPGYFVLADISKIPASESRTHIRLLDKNVMYSIVICAGLSTYGLISAVSPSNYQNLGIFKSTYDVKKNEHLTKLEKEAFDSNKDGVITITEKIEGLEKLINK